MKMKNEKKNEEEEEGRSFVFQLNAHVFSASSLFFFCQFGVFIQIMRGSLSVFYLTVFC